MDWTWSLRDKRAVVVKESGMRYYKAREIQENGNGTGRWHYTCAHGDRVYPVGHCSRFIDCPSCKGQMHVNGEWCNGCNGIGVIDNPSPCPGHATPEEACEANRQYELDRARFCKDEGKEDAQHKCVECGEKTQGTALVGGDCGRPITLCNEHQNRDTLAKHYKGETESWRS